MKKSLILCGLLAGVVAAPAAFAKLPAPPSTPEAKLKAAETAQKAAWSAKIDTFQLCQAQERVAAHVRDGLVAAGKPVPTATPTPPCSDPGPFAFAPPEEPKPIEASGAHSPAATAVSPPSSNQTSAEQNPAPKK
ncbi:hypothetical protein [Variovorax sp. YR216]|uniref:hypothetical protein n=1 Tax=Variovorax sp. YR216 TaxID=1882828 RepID=UPI00089A207F|nr:hypothetical protein [Variovorax sp. YR216]SEA91236.1 hypothetical protein SAMN05444680_104308 [Variovorax sp. YR216]